MGVGVMKNGRPQPITPWRGSWAATVNDTQRVPVTHEAMCLCQQILQEPRLDRNVADAASEAITAYRLGRGIDKAVASVLVAHAAKRGQQDRWGQ